MISQLKEAKIQHVSNLNGCTEYEIFLLASVFLTSYWMWKVIAMKMNKSFFALEFLIIVIPLILSVTILSNQIFSLIGFQVFIIILLHTGSPLPTRGIISNVSKEEAFINAARCFLQISTCIAILAVDFNAFPRKFAKTETYGVSWMDVGVGAFVFSSGLVAGSKQKQHDKTFAKTLKRSFPVLCLGLVRLITTKFVDYQEHVSEYGTHWNFFFTLGILPFLTNLQNIVIGNDRQFAAGIIAILVYQLVLSTQGLDAYILNAPRVSLISMNREGLASLIGFYSIFSISSYCGSEIIRKQLSFSSRSAFLFKSFSIFYGSYIASSIYVFPSRRMANFPFVMFVTSIFIFILTGFLWIDYFFLNDQRQPTLFRAINRNQLVIFLIANLLTGLINLTTDTLSTPNFLSVIILIVYSFLFGLFAMVLDFANISIKL